MPDDRVLQTWLATIDEGFATAVQCFRDVLEELGEGRLAYALPWCEDAPAPPADAPPIGTLNRELQVLSIAFQLLNLVEETAAVQARRAGEAEHGVLGEPGAWGQNIRQLFAHGRTEDEILAALREVIVEVVLTAHPTEAKRPVVLRQNRALFALVQALRDSGANPREAAETRERIKLALERRWRTGEMYLRKPGVETELTYMLDYLRNVFPRVLPVLDARLREAWCAAGGNAERLSTPEAYPRLRFGDWVGGDRDGHPFVTPRVTADTLARLRANAIEVIATQLDDLEEALSLSDLFQTPPPFFTAALQGKLQQANPAAAAAADALPHEPWRQYVALMRHALPAGVPADAAYARPDELLADLAVLRQSLDAVGAARLARAYVLPLERSVQCFGFHTAALDIRQNSNFHDRALVQLAAAADLDMSAWPAWPEERRREWLAGELNSLRPLAPPRAQLGPEAAAVVDTLRVLADYREAHGPEGIGAYIVSMTRDLSDLLLVHLFAREAGLLQAAGDGPVCALSVVPLFETVEDLARAPDILGDYLAHPLVRRSLACEDGVPVQQVMVGYSDSNKGSGIFASQWRLNRAQHALAEVARAHGVQVQFFHGRGGTFSRGAGPTHRFLESLAHGSLTGHFRLTEQGETIAQKYGNIPTAEYNLELLMAGVTATTIKHREPFTLDPALAELGERLCQHSRAAYQDLLQTEGFITFWSEATPIDALEQSFIGSRPARRTGQRTLEDLRAIPWVFSWIQARYYLTGWYGVGTALSRLRDEDDAGFASLCAARDSFRFLRYVLMNAETSLASADVGLMRDYAQLVQDAALRERVFAAIHAEYQRTAEMLEAVFGASHTTRRPRMMKTLHMREAGLALLHQRQIALLKSWRARRAAGDETGAASMLPALLLSINAIANGQRVTG